MWYLGQHPGNQYILEEIIAVSSGPGGFWPAAMTPVCANCAQAPVQHQYVLDEIAAYDQPGIAGLGALAGRAFKVFRVHARRLKTQPQGRVFMPQAASGIQQSQQSQDAQFAPQDAQDIAAQELSTQQPRAKRFLVEPEGIARMRAEGAQIFGGGIGQEAAAERRQIQEAAKRERWNRSPAGQEFFRREAQAGAVRRKVARPLNLQFDNVRADVRIPSGPGWSWKPLRDTSA